MQHHLSQYLLLPTVLLGLTLLSSQTSTAQTLTHHITLPSGMSWCADTMIHALLAEINAVREQRNLPALQMDAVGMKDAETIQTIGRMARIAPAARAA